MTCLSLLLTNRKNNSKLYHIPFISLLFAFSIGHAQVVKDGIARKIGDSIEQSFARGDLTFFKENANNRVFNERVLISEEGNTELNLINKGFEDANLIHSIGQGIINSIQTGSSYTFINYYSDQYDNYYLRFRLFGESGLNYHEYLLEFESYEDYYISDVFVYTTGQFFSQTMYSLYKPIVFKALKNPENKANASSMSLGTLQVLRSISDLVKKGKDKKARRLFYSLPEHIRSQDFMTHYELLVVDVEDEKRYSDFLNRLEKKTQSKMALFLLSIDKLFLAKKYEKAIATVDSLYRYVGDDFLDLYRANAYSAWDKDDSAEVYYLRLEKNYPYYTDTYDGLLDIYNRLKMFDKAIALIERMNKTLFQSKKKVNQIIKKGYPVIYKSTEYTKWYRSKVD